MSTNAYTRLRALLPPPALLFGKVIAHNDLDDTSTIELPLGLGAQSYAPGVSVGQTIKARGRTVPVGGNAFVRAGLVETRAPDGLLQDVVVGIVTPRPFGPDPLSLSASPIVAPAGATSTAYVATSVAAAFSGGYPPLTYAVTAGALPNGLTLSPAGLITGTPTVAATFSGIVVTATDSSGASVAAAPFSVTIAVGSAPLALSGNPIVVPDCTFGEYTPTSVVGAFTGGVAPLTYAVTAGALPTGMDLTTAGMIGDSQFANVLLLLNFDGANNSTTFTDSSSYARAVTPSGDAKISTAKWKFGGSAALFDGNGDYLSVAGADFDLPADFTIEMYISAEGAGDDNQQHVAQTRTTSGNGWLIQYDRAAKSLAFVSDSGGLAGLATAPNSIVDGTLHHVAVTRSGSTIRLFLDGALIATASSGQNFTASNLMISRRFESDGAFHYFNGYIDAFRITKGGAARYVAAFGAPAPGTFSGIVVTATDAAAQSIAAAPFSVTVS